MATKETKMTLSEQIAAAEAVLNDLKARAAKEAEDQERKNANATIANILEEANAKLKEATALADKYKLTFYWSGPFDESITYDGWGAGWDQPTGWQSSNC